MIWSWLKSEFTSRLNTDLNNDVISDVRSSLYSEMKSKGLMENGDQLQSVSRRKCDMDKTVREKHIEEIWCLMCSIKDSPHVLTE